MKWFWNSALMNAIENLFVNVTNFIWRKRRAEEKKIVNTIKEATDAKAAKSPASKKTAKKPGQTKAAKQPKK
jgi:hypothetical protein